MQELDYEWDARIDKLIKDYYKEQNIETKDLILKYTGDKKKRKDKMIYTFCNNNFLYLVYKAMKKIYKVLVKIL